MSDITEFSNFIGGEWRAADCEHWIDDYAPATGAHIARIPCSSAEDGEAAVDAALNAATKRPIGAAAEDKAQQELESDYKRAADLADRYKKIPAGESEGVSGPFYQG